MFFSCSVAAAKEARADSSSTAILAENMNTRRLSDGFQPSVLINWEGGGLSESKINRETPILLVQPDGRTLEKALRTVQTRCAISSTPRTSRHLGWVTADQALHKNPYYQKETNFRECNPATRITGG